MQINKIILEVHLFFFKYVYVWLNKLNFSNNKFICFCDWIYKYKLLNINLY